MARIVRSNFRRRRPFRPRRYRKRRSWLNNYHVQKWLFILAVFVLFCIASYIRDHHWDNAEHPALRSSVITVVDGDTVRSDGQIYRLVGFNTPESGWRAGCGEERALAAKATARLEQLVTGGNADLRRVACACPTGSEGGTACNYGRLCAKLKVNSRDVGTILIAEGLAERYVCGAKSCPPRRVWCD